MSDPRIRVSQLHFSWPDGTPVLEGLSFVLGASRTGLVAPNGAGKSTLLRLLAGELLPQSGQVEVHGRVAYLPQQLSIAPGATVADALGISDRLAALDAILAGDADPAVFARLGEDGWDLRERAMATLARLGLGELALTRRIADFSGGEAMSLALAARLLQRPDVLLLDEPTHHLDRHARHRLREVLADWSGCLLVASHDRELLEGMDQIGELHPAALRLHGGGWSFYRQALAMEQQAAGQQLRHLRGEVKRQQRERQQARERADRRAGNAARNLADAGLPRIVAGNRERSAQVAAGRADGVHAGRLHDARTQLREAALAAADAALPDFVLPATRVAAGQRVFHGEGLEVRHGTRDLFGPDGITLSLRGPERVALIGANGAGKSTLLRILAGDLAPDAGRVHRGPGRVAWLSQRLDLLDPAASVADNLAAFAPAMPPAERAGLLARLQFRGARTQLPVGVLSGGERLRAVLACVLHAEPAPQLLLLDEPTNNLDLDAVAQFEQALRGYQGALVVASHDAAFLDAIGITRRLLLEDGVLREA